MSQSYQPITQWPLDDRPREKLIRYGETQLSDAELLAILLRTGVRGYSAIDLSRQIMSKFKTFRNMSHTDTREWNEFKGLGPAKIALIKAALEIGRRFREQEQRSNPIIINHADEAAAILMPQMRDLKIEVFKVILLNNQNRIIEVVEQVRGTVNQANPFIREIIQLAIQKFALSIICVHNHPSGLVQPSEADRRFTRKLADASKILEINLLDHIIIGDGDFYSFADQGLL